MYTRKCGGLILRGAMGFQKGRVMELEMTSLKSLKARLYQVYTN